MAENSLKVGKINIGTRPIDSPPTPTSETPFCIVVMGDFSGQERPAISDVASKRLHRVDRDNFDEVLAEMKVVVRLPSSQSESQETTIPIRNREDLHPDSLYERLDLFRELRVLRKKLTDAMTFEEGLAEWQSLMGDETNDRPPEEDQVEKPSGAEISDEKLLDQMLQSSQVQSSQEKQDWQYHLKKIAAPYILPNREDEQKEVLPQVDSILSIILRAILHGHPFQEIESAWLSVDFLVHRLESDTIQIFLLDVSKSEMVADFENDDLQACGLYKVLVEQTGGTAGGLPVSLLVGNYVFEQSGDDARILSCIAKIANWSGAPFIAGANSSVFGCPSLNKNLDPRTWQTDPEKIEKAWQNLRQLPEACYLGLAGPRFLLRLPFGKNTRPTENFAFEEMPENPEHESYLWGNSAILCAFLLGQAFTKSGWHMKPGQFKEVNNLPFHTYKKDGETIAKPTAEVPLTDRAVDTMRSMGVIPVISPLNQDLVQVLQFLSISETAATLCGRWS